MSTQFGAQQIFFPAKGSQATAGAEFAPMRKYAGKTYAQLSAEAQADPTNVFGPERVSAEAIECPRDSPPIARGNRGQRRS